jgi:hypothetical protein
MRSLKVFLLLASALAIGCGEATDQDTGSGGGGHAEGPPSTEPGLSLRLELENKPITIPMAQSLLNMPFEQSQSALTHSSGCPGASSSWGDATTNQDIDDATELTNRIRKSFGFDCVIEEPVLSVTAWRHSKYANSAFTNPPCQAASAHDEISGCPEFSGVTFGARVRASASQAWPYAEVMISGAPGAAWSAQKSIDTWMVTAYHQLPFLECEGNVIGYGPNRRVTDWRGHTVNAMTLDFANTAAACNSNGVSHWPHSGTWGVARSWDGNETPRPPVNYPSGPVFTVRRPGGRIVGVSLLDLSTSPATGVAGAFFTGFSPDPHHDPNNLLLPNEAIFVPASPLKAQTFYEIHFPTSAGEDIWWQIKTGD